MNENLLKKYKHYSFDLDGTLVHTVPEYRYKTVTFVVNKLGGKNPSQYSINRFWFEASRSKIIQDEFGLDPEKFWELFRKTDSLKERSKHSSAYEDAEPALRKLKEQNKTISIITGAPHELAQMEIGKLNNAPYDYYFSIKDSQFNEKPDPRSLTHVLNELGLKAKETVYIGNSNEDAYFALNAGVDFIYIERKEHKFDLRKEAVGVIHNLSQLI